MPAALRAAADVAPSDSARALQLLNIAGVAAAYAGDQEAAVAIGEAARDLATKNRRSSACSPSS